MMTPEERQHHKEHWQETRRVIMQLFADLDEKDEEIAALRQRVEDLENTAWEKSE